MNKGLIWGVALVLLTATTNAERVRLPITLRGTIHSTTNQVVVTEQSLVSQPGNRLVLMVDSEAGVVAVEEWDATLARRVDRDPTLNGTQSLLENFRMAMIPGRSPQLMANLEMVDLDWDGDGHADADGSMQLIARPTFDAAGRLIRITGQLIGVFNDPINGVAGDLPRVLRALVRSAGPPF